MKGNLSGIRIAVLVCSGFEEREMTQPRAALIEAGAMVDLISPEPGQVKAWLHGKWTNEYKVDIALAEANPKDYDGLVLPGGVINPDKLRTHQEAIKFIDHFFKSNKPIAAICHGPQSLIETKKLKKRKMTSYHSIKTDLINAGARWQNKAVIVDKNLVTSRKPDDIPAFNTAFIKVLTKNIK